MFAKYILIINTGLILSGYCTEQIKEVIIVTLYSVIVVKALPITSTCQLFQSIPNVV